MSKTLEVLFDKARNNGESNKNARMELGWGQKGQLREQWHVIDENGRFELRHWGTAIFSQDENGNIDVYGESNSDRDALNQVFDYKGLDLHAHYYPSRSMFEVHDSMENVEFSI